MRATARLAIAAALALATLRPAYAVNPEEQLAAPKLEARARAISRELRCVVCQSQTIDDSTAPVAQALRKLVRDRLVAGDSDRAVIAAVTARYGDFVLLKPRFSAETALLWLGPFLVLCLAGLGGLKFVRSQEADAQSPRPLTEQEQLRLSEMLDQS